MPAARTHPFDGTCPICGDQMTVTRVSCGSCGSALEGAFTLEGRASEATPSADDRGHVERERIRYGRLARLDDQQLEFVEAFLRCRGIIKNVEDMLGISYPTVRARLNVVLESMGFASAEEMAAPLPRRRRRDILADLAVGKITTEEAHRLLAQLQSATEDGDEDR